MRIKGKVIKWNAERAFGFIAPNTGGEHVFIHKSALKNRQREPKINDVITFTLGTDKDGRKNAQEATFAGEKLPTSGSHKQRPFGIYVALTFLTVIAGAYFVGIFSQNLVLLYFGLSAATFVAYALDKHKAKQGAWRTPEATLHMIALMGGWPGAALAQQILRHKSSKKEFLIGFWFTVVANIGLLVWFVFPI